MSSPFEIKTSHAGSPADLRLFLLPNSEPDQQNQRQSLRQQLKESLENQGHSSSPTLMDLLQLPAHEKLSLSVSHCADFGAFGWCEKPYKLGVDVESVLRLKKETVARVCSPQEMATAPRPEFLWSAKEAVFKALSPQINVLSFVEIFDWVSLQAETGQELWQYSARVKNNPSALRGRGEVRLILGHILCFFLLET